eukprot:6176761-Pleurochrysis_carterae.AAC.3
MCSLSPSDFLSGPCQPSICLHTSAIAVLSSLPSYASFLSQLHFPTSPTPSHPPLPRPLLLGSSPNLVSQRCAPSRDRKEATRPPSSISTGTSCIRCGGASRLIKFTWQIVCDDETFQT